MAIKYHPSSSDDESSTNSKSFASRKFIPSEIYGQDCDLDSTHYDDGKDWTHVPCPYRDPCHHCGRLERHIDCLIIAIDGACRGNGTPSAESAIGVYFAESSQWNVARCLNSPPATSQRAELEACMEALYKVRSIKTTGVLEVSQIVIKADSEYVVKGMTKWIVKWRKNGYKTAKGAVVTNNGLFRIIDRLIEELNNMDVNVMFWHVPRLQNQEADTLANSAYTLAHSAF